MTEASALQARFLCKGEGKGLPAMQLCQCDPYMCSICTARPTHPGQLETSFFTAVEGTGAKGSGPCGIPRSSPVCSSCSHQGCPIYLLLGDKSTLKGKILVWAERVVSSPESPKLFQFTVLVLSLSCTMHLLVSCWQKTKQEVPMP